MTKYPQINKVKCKKIYFIFVACLASLIITCGNRVVYSQVKSEVDKYKGFYRFSHETISLKVKKGGIKTINFNALAIFNKKEGPNTKVWAIRIDFINKINLDPKKVYFLSDGSRIVSEVEDDSTYEDNGVKWSAFVITHDARTFRDISCSKNTTAKIGDTVLVVGDTAKKRMRTIFEKAPREYSSQRIISSKCKIEESETKEPEVTEPRLIGGIKSLQDSLEYPDRAKKAGLEGNIEVSVTVDKKGNPRGINVTQGAHKTLNEAAIEAVKKQKFKPGSKDGEPVETQMSLPVKFRLPN